MRNETRPDSLLAQEFGPEYGYFGAVAAHAFGATRHMHLYGTTRDQFGEIAVAFREHALRNPDAQMKKPLSMAQYHEAAPVVAPFGLLRLQPAQRRGRRCHRHEPRASARSAAAAGLDQGFRQLQQPARLVRRRQHGDDGGEEQRRSGLRMAGLGPDDVDTAQIYDCFTYMVLTQLEDYGFCKKGEGGPFVASGALRMGGRLPTNTSGGQLSEAHVEGMLQVVEGARQMRHTYPAERQVAGCRDCARLRPRRQPGLSFDSNSRRRVMDERTNAPRKKPVPRPAPESVPYWQAAREHRLELPRCNACGNILVSAVAELPALPRRRFHLDAACRGSARSSASSPITASIIRPSPTTCPTWWRWSSSTKARAC